ncbi:MAG: hypothetical protein PHU21_01830 [Elusimicrobia bacterium]|nr:hypothetical protein [Elusimicrobiota bacterium]
MSAEGMLFDRSLPGRLIRPLRAGSALPGGGRLQGARLSEDGQRLIYRLSPGGLELVVQKPADSQPSLARTRHFSIWLRGAAPGPLPPGREALVKAVVALIRRNDTASVKPWADPAPRARPTASLYLVPGHLGDPDDIGVRSLKVLQEVRNIFVEKCNAPVVAEILVRHGMRPADKRIVPVEYGPRARGALLRRLRAVAARDEDMCLFGACEGTPTFCDPGKDLIREAARPRGRVRIRSLGGASALATALMRVEEPVDRFMFYGVVGRPAVLESLRPCLVQALRFGLAAGFLVTPRFAAARLGRLDRD